MRGLLTATVLTAVLLTGAGCADRNDENPFDVGFASPAPPATSVPGGTPSPAASGDAGVCAAGWRDALRQEAARAADPQLKTLLAELASEVGGLGTDVETIDEAEFDRLQQRLDQLCPR